MENQRKRMQPIPEEAKTERPQEANDYGGLLKASDSR